MAVDQREYDELEEMLNDLGGEDMSIGDMNEDNELQTESEEEILDFNETDEETDETEDDESDNEDSTDGETDEGINEDEIDDGNEPSGDEKDTKPKVSEFEAITIKVNGYDVSIDNKEELMKYVNLGANTFGKEPKKDSEADLIAKQANLSAEDMKLLAEVKKGSKEAIAKLAKNSNIDILDVDSEMAEQYKQSIQYTTPTEVDMVASEILSDEAHSTHFRQVVKTLPNSFVEAVTSNASDLRAFSSHLKSGLFDQVIPKAIKLAQTNDISLIDAYIQVGRNMSTQKPQVEAKPERRESPAMKEVRKRANSGKQSTTTRTAKTDTQDVWDAEGDDWESLKDSVFR